MTARAPAQSGEPGAPSRRTLAWIEPRQQDLCRAVAQHASLSLVGVGVPLASGRGVAREIAEGLGAPHIDDLRQAVATTEADLLLFAASEAGDDDPTLDDADLLRLCREKGLRIASLEPAPSRLVDLHTYEKALGGLDASGAGLVRIVPAMRRSRGFIAALDVVESIAPVRTISVSQRGARGQGSLAARLYDAMDVVLALLGEPESIDAAASGPAAAQGVHLAPGESLRDLRGDLTANLRFASGRSASITLSDDAGRWFRGVTILATGGCLRLDDTSFELISPAGETIDRSRSRLSSGSRDDPSAAVAIGGQIDQMLDPRGRPATPTDVRMVLAMCEAALLSARTGQGESPSTIVRMAGAV